MKILGVETSCDETAVAVVENGRKVLSNIVVSQISEHNKYGGVVPEIASRRHTEWIGIAAKNALSEAGIKLEDIDAVAVTYAPGLIGALLIGVGFAKGLCYSLKKSLVPVHHLEGHIASLYISYPDLTPPFTVLVASGGHSHLIEVKDYTKFKTIGRAVDDAAGEAFDKVARKLGLGYPGGPAIARMASYGNPKGYELPNPKTKEPLDVSFSGLKTAVINIVNSAQMKGQQINVEDLAASFQDRVCDMLSSRLVESVKKSGLPIAVCGGVAANKVLKTKTEMIAAKEGIEVYFADRELCGDNAAMIASAGYYNYLNGVRGGLDLNAYATREIEEDSF
ncbi:MAG: tRNA (adenosine(37)-N6)-threonylcarbamoyltransferase complex transferase subunit TsaD [Ruminococcaceae bacterium]|nr:tRNA (adenosine(37)-N6)-threonylcarbamoyltransferase complex transferase subunit TsaD [Oscillospiraceae bacterium]